MSSPSLLLAVQLAAPARPTGSTWFSEGDNETPPLTKLQVPSWLLSARSSFHNSSVMPDEKA
jgi:proteasome lid subunit RPN8/RPN11